MKIIIPTFLQTVGYVYFAHFMGNERRATWGRIMNFEFKILDGNWLRLISLITEKTEYTEKKETNSANKYESKKNVIFIN